MNKIFKFFLLIVSTMLLLLCAVFMHDKAVEPQPKQELITIVGKDDNINVEPVVLAVIGFGLMIYGILYTGKRK